MVKPQIEMKFITIRRVRKEQKFSGRKVIGLYWYLVTRAYHMYIFPITISTTNTLAAMNSPMHVRQKVEISVWYFVCVSQHFITPISMSLPSVVTVPAFFSVYSMNK